MITTKTAQENGFNRSLCRTFFRHDEEHGIWSISRLYPEPENGEQLTFLTVFASQKSYAKEQAQKWADKFQVSGTYSGHDHPSAPGKVEPKS